MAMMRSVGVRLRLWTREYERDAHRAAEATDDIGDAGRRAKVELHGMAGAMDRAAESSRGLARASGGSGGGFGRRGLGLHGYGVAGIAAAITASAPMLGAMIAGAIVGGAGLGGIVGGILAAKDDPRVREAGGEFMDTLQAEWSQAGVAFVAPTVKALGILEQAAIGMDIAGILRPAASHMDELARGAAGFALEFGEGFGEAMRNAGPFLDELAEQLPDIGDALGDFLAGLSKNQGALEGWAALLNLVEGAIEGTGAALQGLSTLYRLNTDVLQAQAWYPAAAALVRTRVEAVGYGAALDGVAGAATGAAAATEELDPATRDLADRFGLTAVEAAALAGELDELDRGLRSLIDGAFGLTDAHADLEEGIDTLTEQIKEQRDANVEGAGGFDLSTEAGRDNYAVLKDIIEAQAAITMETAKASGSTEEAAATVEGFTARMQALADMLGIDISQLDAYNRAVAEMDRLVTVDIVHRFTTVGQPYRPYGGGFVEGFRWGGIRHAATGLMQATTVSSPTVLFGERQTEQEAFVPKRGNYSRSMSILSQAAGWYGADVVPRGGMWGGGGGGGPSTVQVVVSPKAGASRDLMQSILDGMRFEVTQSGGGNVQDHTGRRGRFS